MSVYVIVFTCHTLKSPVVSAGLWSQRHGSGVTWLLIFQGRQMIGASLGSEVTGGAVLSHGASCVVSAPREGLRENALMVLLI